MRDRKTIESEKFSGCFERMREMMKRMRSGKDGPCCLFSGTMAEMMSGCCSRTETEGRTEDGDKDTPK